MLRGHSEALRSSWSHGLAQAVGAQLSSFTGQHRTEAGSVQCAVRGVLLVSFRPTRPELRAPAQGTRASAQCSVLLGVPAQQLILLRLTECIFINIMINSPQTNRTGLLLKKEFPPLPSNNCLSLGYNAEKDLSGRVHRKAMKCTKMDKENL